MSTLTPTTTRPLFAHGQVVITRRIAGQTESSPAALLHVVTCVTRHLDGDFGDLDEEDTAANHAALVDEHLPSTPDLTARRGRVLSNYPAPDDGITTRFWVITEADRSTTTVLHPEDY